jgi:hypothetical protein
MTGPYSRAGRDAQADGYSSLPLPPGHKKPPPDGWTGRDAPMTSAADVEAWRETRGHCNVALRLPAGVIGIDSDAHKSAGRRREWDKLTEILGPLPETAPWCTSRDDGVSGVRLFRVPDGYTAAGNLPGDPSPGETIQHAHRYLVAPPSIVPPPEGNGQPYRWVVPLRPARDLPWLPVAWLRVLAARGGCPQQPARHAGGDAPGRWAGLVAWVSALRDGDQRWDKLNWAAWVAGCMIAEGHLGEADARARLLAAADACGFTADHGQREALRQIDRGLGDGAR